MLSFIEALDIINKEVDAINYPQNPKDLYTPIEYILSLKGKKVRPVLTLLAHDMYKENIQEAVKPALAWEIFHNFTLMHDDLMDKADVRRGKPVVYKVWGENTAILSGDAMLILAYQYIAETPSPYLKTILDLFSTTSMEICEGQQYDMHFESRMDVSIEEYLSMIRLKTAVLLGAALKTGAIIGGASLSDANHLYDFGVNLGISFQIKDDLLDVYGNPEVFGKQTGGDILCNKKTYLLIHALNLATGNLKDELLKQISIEPKDKKSKIEAVTSIYNELNIKEIAENGIQEFYHKALNSLQALKVSDDKKKVLKEFAEQLMNRES